MGLKYRINSLTEVAEAVQSLYKREGDGYVLDADGVVPKERLDEFRNNNVHLQQQLDKLKDVDPVKYRELMDLDKKVREKQLIEAGKVEEAINLRVDAMRTEFTEKEKTYTTELDASRRQLSSLLIDNVVKSAAIKSGVLPTALDDVQFRAHHTFVVENGAPVMKKEGQVVYGKDGKTPMTPNEWVTDLRKTAPHLFAGSNGGGAGGGSRHGGGVDFDKMSPDQLITMGLDNGALTTPAAAGLPSE